MSFTKINYVDNETIITAESLNNIQNAILSIHQNATFVGDLNEACEPGHYWIRCVDCTNTPYGDNREGIFGFLEVIAPWKSGNDVEQRFINYIDGKTFVRSSVNGWKSWTNTALLSYPVGSIYQSISSTSPASLFGGVWEQIMDRFLLADGSTYTAGATGGAATVTLTTNQIPSHNHYFKDGTHTFLWGQKWTVYIDAQAHGGGSPSNNLCTQQNTHVNTQNTGGGQSHNNMPPYLVVYIWKRIS